MVGYLIPPVPLRLLLCSTRNTLRHGTVLCGIVVYLTGLHSPPQDLSDLETVWDLLQEGP